MTYVEKIEEKIKALEDLICNADSVYWLAHTDLKGAVDWEKQAKELLEKRLDEFTRI